MSSTTRVAFCEVQEQITVLLNTYGGQSLPFIIAISPSAYFMCEELGLPCRSIEDFGNVTSLTPTIGPENIQRVEALCALFNSTLYAVGTNLPECSAVSMQFCFHPLKGFVDSLTLRTLPVLEALTALAPDEVVAFEAAQYPIPGNNLLDKPPVGLTTAVVPIVAEHLGISTVLLPCPSPFSAQPVVAEPRVTLKTAVGIFFQQIRRLMGKLRLSNVRRKYALLFRKELQAEELAGAWDEYLGHIRRSTSMTPTLLGTGSGLDGYLASVLAQWESADARMCLSCYPPATLLPPALAASIQKEARKVASVAVEKFLNEPRLEELCRFKGLDLSHFLVPYITACLGRWLQNLLEAAHLARAYYAGFTNALLLLGGMSNIHHVLVRCARREGVPVVSSHKGGFLGYSYLPVLERYDLAECDFFCCNGPGAVTTFRNSHPEACWNPETPRAVPVALCAPWASPGSAEHSPQNPHGLNRRIRIMYVMSAFLGDNCYLGYSFSPEIWYARFQMKVLDIARAHSNVDFIFKPPLEGRYPQLQAPVLKTIKDGAYPWMSISEDIPLSRLLDDADIYIVDNPSTPLTDIAPTEKALILYIDKDIYRLASHAREPLRRRAVFSENEEDFFRSLETVLQAPEEFIAAPVDHTFTSEFLTGGRDGGCPQMIVDFLESILPQGNAT